MLVVKKMISATFCECVRIVRHLKIFREDQEVIPRKPNKSETLVRSSNRPVTLLNFLGKVLEKVVQKIALLTANIIPKYQFG